MDNMRFGAFVAQLRKEKGLTQKELANLLGVTDKAVSSSMSPWFWPLVLGVVAAVCLVLAIRVWRLEKKLRTCIHKRVMPNGRGIFSSNKAI